MNHSLVSRLDRVPCWGKRLVRALQCSVRWYRLAPAHIRTSDSFLVSGFGAYEGGSTRMTVNRDCLIRRKSGASAATNSGHRAYGPVWAAFGHPVQ